jgi:hypothetical protein
MTNDVVYHHVLSFMTIVMIVSRSVRDGNERDKEHVPLNKENAFFSRSSRPGLKNKLILGQ